MSEPWLQTSTGQVVRAATDAVAGRPPGPYPARSVRLAALCARDKPPRLAMTVSHPEDLALVRAAITGDRAARERLAERLACVGRMVAARNRRFGGVLDEHALRDVTSDVVARVLQKLGEYAGFAAFESWVYVFCEGELRNAVRRRRRLSDRETSAVDGAAEALPAPAQPEGNEDVQLCLQKLPELDQRAVRWKHFEDLTLEEIAARFAMKINTVKSRYLRALRQLKLCLQRRAAGGEA